MPSEKIRYPGEGAACCLLQMVGHILQDRRREGVPPQPSFPGV